LSRPLPGPLNDGRAPDSLKKKYKDGGEQGPSTGGGKKSVGGKVDLFRCECDRRRTLKETGKKSGQRGVAPHSWSRGERPQGDQTW